MQLQEMQIGFVTDEVSRDLAHSLEVCHSWGIRLFELREGGTRRFPFFDDTEIRLVRAAIEAGATITAVSPGVFKDPVENVDAIKADLSEKFPVALERAKDFGCNRMIVFGFEVSERSSQSRSRVIDIMRRAADLAGDVGVVLAIENEPDFWFDRPSQCVELLEEIGHPSLKLNWDPANMHWGGRRPVYEDFEIIRPHMVNLHVKDFTPNDADMPWRPVGEGTTPWIDILTWVSRARADGMDLDHLTIETHYIPAEEGSKRSLENVRTMLRGIEDRSGLEHQDR